MGAKTKIDWADASWNPVTGCLHGCEYCYARKIAERFKGYNHIGSGAGPSYTFDEKGGSTVLRTLGETGGPFDFYNTVIDKKDGGRTKFVRAPYPFGFNPTLHHELLEVPQHWKKPRTIFVCSMADLFGEWVLDSWIETVLKACERAPQHRYLFLTKNPKRYGELLRKGIVLPNTIDWMYGFTMDGASRLPDRHPLGYRVFCSIEPILNKPDELLDIIELTDWCIVGAETGNRQGKVVPERSWIESIVQRCQSKNIPVFMKESLRELMGSDFTQETPWDVRK